MASTVYTGITERGIILLADPSLEAPVLEDLIVRTKNRPERLAAVHPAVADARAVMFDFDFTLADSSEGVVICVNHALSRMGLPESPADAIARTIGWT